MHRLTYDMYTVHKARKACHVMLMYIHSSTVNSVQLHSSYLTFTLALAPSTTRKLLRAR